MKTTTINITQENIDESEASFCNCPIARALKDMGYDSPFVGISNITPNRSIRGPVRTYDLPQEAAALSEAHDVFISNLKYQDPDDDTASEDELREAYHEHVRPMSFNIDDLEPPTDVAD